MKAAVVQSPYTGSSFRWWGRWKTMWSNSSPSPPKHCHSRPSFPQELSSASCRRYAFSAWPLGILCSSTSAQPTLTSSTAWDAPCAWGEGSLDLGPNKCSPQTFLSLQNVPSEIKNKTKKSASLKTWIKSLSSSCGEIKNQTKSLHSIKTMQYPKEQYYRQIEHLIKPIDTIWLGLNQWVTKPVTQAGANHFKKIINFSPLLELLFQDNCNKIKKASNVKRIVSWLSILEGWGTISIVFDWPHFKTWTQSGKKRFKIMILTWCLKTITHVHSAYTLYPFPHPLSVLST